MIEDMVTTNKQTEQSKLNQTMMATGFMNRSFMASVNSSSQGLNQGNRRSQSIFDNETQSTVGMLNEYMIAMRNKQNDQVRKNNLREELNRQMQEKERLKVLERLQVNEKEFAINKKLLMRSISPDLFNKGVTKFQG